MYEESAVKKKIGRSKGIGRLIGTSGGILGCISISSEQCYLDLM